MESIEDGTRHVVGGDRWRSRRSALSSREHDGDIDESAEHLAAFEGREHAPLVHRCGRVILRQFVTN